jgi:hypothetical protein
MLGAIIIFGVSLVALSGLFAVKAWELAHDTTYFSALREKTDSWALKGEHGAKIAQKLISLVPPLVLMGVRKCIHACAVSFAKIARIAEKQAHEVAHMVSNPYRDWKPQQSSVFLKEVSAHRDEIRTAQKEQE